MGIRNLPDGYVATLFGNGDDAGSVKVGGKGIATPVTFTGVEHPYPVTRKALEAAYKDLVHTVVDVDGEEHTLRGIDAAAAKFWTHALETVRGWARARLVKGLETTPEMVRREYAAFLTVGGQTRSGSKPVATEDEVSGLTKEELIAMLKARGAIG
jgi:hypothetical protein